MRAPEEGQETKRMARSEAYIVVLAERTSGVFRTEQASLAKVGVDAKKMAAEVDRLITEFTAADQQQEALKRQLKAQSELVASIKQRLAVTGSGYLDVGIGALGKDSSAADNLRRMRSDIEREIRSGKTAEEPAPPA